MPLQMENEFRFPMGATESLDKEVVNDFLSMMKRVSASIEKQQVNEIYKQHFCKVTGDYYTKSSSLEWAESDMIYQAYNAAKDAPNFIAAIYDAFEELNQFGAMVPQEQNINQVLSRHQSHFHIVDGQLNTTDATVATPQVSESISTTVMRALGDAKALIGTVNSSSAIDRAHTALHGYLVQLCVDKGIPLTNDATVSKAFKELRRSHPALQETGNRADEISRVLNSFAASIDAFSTLRNKASLAHVNDLLDVPEATATVNSMYTIFRYVQDSLARHKQSFVQ